MRAQLPWIGYERLSGLWAGSSLRMFWHWWLKQLRDCLPGKWQRHSVEHIYHWPLAAPPDPPATAVQAVLVLQPDQALLRTLTLPLAANSALDNVLAYELDRFTPLRPDQAHHVVHRRAVMAGRLHVTIVAVRRDHMAQWLETFAEHGISLSRIDLLDNNGRRIGVQLLPAKTGQGGKRPGSRRLLVLALGLIILLLVGALMTLQSRESFLASRTVEVNARRAQVAELQGMRRELEQVTGSEMYLLNLKQRQTSRSLLLADLSTCLPQDTWLQSLQINREGQVDLAGFSSNPSSLISQIKRCPRLVDAQYQGVIQPDAVAGKDRFYMRAHLSRGDQDVSVTVSP